MKLFKYCIYISLIFCGCADATQKEKLSELTCPAVLPAEKDFPAGWVTLGQASDDKFLIREADLISGNVLEEKKRLNGVKDRSFSSEMIDEWTEIGDRAEANIAYDADHTDLAMKCTYSKTQKEGFDSSRNVVLLIQLPAEKSIDCLLVRRDVDPQYALSCKAK